MNEQHAQTDGAALWLMLEHLRDGDWHTGKALAEEFSITRAGIWKRIQHLRMLGLAIETGRGLGYRLVQPLELLDTETIITALPPAARALLHDLEVHRMLDSTNTQLMRQACQSRAQVCLAEYQSAGKGRRGRSWASPFGANLYLSLRWHFAELPADLPALALATGVMTIQALGGLAIDGVRLKWPNDLVYSQRKLGGILLQVQSEHAGACDVIAGIGINVAMPAAAGAAVTQPWIDLREIQGQIISRNRLAAALLTRLLLGYAEFARSGFARFIADWRQHDALQGQVVRVEHDGQIIEGTALGIDEHGALLIEGAHGRMRFYSGDTSLRAAS
jgi:BirA family biotin operon repressor/biotin-[acetyl-CoA-carboxylase] ligase